MVCSASQCICAQKSTCSCGSRPALQCNCERQNIENKLPDLEDACSCGKRLKNECTCGMKSICDGHRDEEIDFTELK
ncbi:uncharacterized protein KGF55_003205 [Candida pseudojiufengensis]|uniref:uncharacterized protein n=1 Tax=Candida pseudojiufengensis TaxID=497109 RepID=UPI002225185D|nr:uncharacterized protein KGF55_003205 [Candida pseudojiufengensis]KAI5962129.1 hypothetical protein KGF55_003205 [Candida pseudojiufengensis]